MGDVLMQHPEDHKIPPLLCALLLVLRYVAQMGGVQINELINYSVVFCFLFKKHNPTKLLPGPFASIIIRA